MGKNKKGPKKGLSDARKKAAPPKALNPFEIHVNRQKFEVLGRKLKADRGLPGVARAKALKKRKATLLQEYKLKDKSNKFLDRRIGESNSGMTAEDKMTARFTAERMRSQSRKAMYNLADDEVLTHRGQTLNEIEKFDDPRSDDEDDENDSFQPSGNLDAKFVREAHFGGGLLSRVSEDGADSRKDLIDKLISESKKRKAEQQKTKEQTLDLTEKLDSTWKDLLPVMTSAAKASEVEKPKPDSYDTLMRELKFEARGKPSDKLKTVDEVAREEKEKLEELEAARLRRMQGITEPSENAARNHRSADDLDDNFAMDLDEDENENDSDENDTDEKKGSEMDDEGLENNGSDEDEEGEGGSDDDESGDDEDDLEDLKYDSSDEENAKDNISLADEDGDDGNDSDEVTDDDDDDDDSDEVIEPKGKKQKSLFHIGSVTDKKGMESKQSPSTSNGASYKVDKAEAIREDLRKRKKLMEAARKELPYTFEVPSAYEELRIALAGRSPDFQGVIVERMIKCTHPSLGSGNKEKLAHLFTLLMQHLHDAGAADEDENVCWAVLDRLAPSLFDITQWCPNEIAQCLRHVIQEKQQEYRSSKKKFPGVETMLYFKLISLLFPTSDFRHPVVTPALVFMGQILSKCRLETRQDVARGLLLVSLFLEYTSLSNRFSPESVNFLRNILYLCSKFPSTLKITSRAKLPEVRCIPPLRLLPQPSLSLRPAMDDKSSKTCDPDDRLKASDLIGKAPVDDEFCLTTLLTSLRMLSVMISQLTSQPACRHIFSPFTPLLESLIEEKWVPQKVKEEIKKVQELLLAVKNTSLKLIAAAPKRPTPLKLFEPKLEHVYADGKQRRPMSKEKQESQKLLHRYKKERKGALREIRKDRDFLSKIRMKQQLKSDVERKEKVKRIFSEASIQQGEIRKFSKKK
ncbi:nucleolar protein 14 homolog [Thrips palmi]|uniref:Nucleolar protein 14 homolog n=1 Tax=Thrips palmi TaxID=161013 RepID=A0A6P9AF09_THRPL|nr:nucleolar protein 14 homolog [Thrips palmi]